MLNIDTRLLDEVNENELFWLLKIATYLDKDMSCFPSVATQMNITGWAKQKVCLVRDKCIEKGLVNSIPQFRENGAQTSNLYTLKTDKLSVFVNLQNKGDIDKALPKNRLKSMRGGTENQHGGGTENQHGGGTENQHGGGTENQHGGGTENHTLSISVSNTLPNEVLTIEHSSSSKISHEIFEGSFEEKKESLSPKNENKKEEEKKGVSVKKTLSRVKNAKEANPKERPHLHIPFIETYQKFHKSIKGYEIPNAVFSSHTLPLKKLRLLMIEISENFQQALGKVASDEYVMRSFNDFLLKSWEVCKNDPKYSAAKFSPRFLAHDPLELLEKIKSNTKNGSNSTGERPNPGMQVRNAIIASERTHASSPILTAADFERMAKELA